MLGANWVCVWVGELSTELRVQGPGEQSPGMKAGGELKSGQNDRAEVNGDRAWTWVRREEELSPDVSKAVRIAPPGRHVGVEQEGHEFSTGREDSSGKGMVSL